MKEISKVLIDSVYINSGGGKIILIEIINKLEKLKLLSNFFFLFDKRLEKNGEIPFKNFKKHYCSSNYLSNRQVSFLKTNQHASNECFSIPQIFLIFV